MSSEWWLANPSRDPAGRQSGGLNPSRDRKGAVACPAIRTKTKPPLAGPRGSDGLTAVLIEPVKEQQAQIRQLQCELEGLKARLKKGSGE